MAKQVVDADLVRQLAALLDETGLTELEYATHSLRVRVGRQHPAITAVTTSPTTVLPAAMLGAASVPEIHANAITSPMVGTVYLAAEPGAAPFVKIGDMIEEGQTILIIEAMKVMNPFPAPRSGRISRVLVRDAQPVEYGEALFVID